MSIQVSIQVSNLGVESRCRIHLSNVGVDLCVEFTYRIHISNVGIDLGVESRVGRGT